MTRIAVSLTTEQHGALMALAERTQLSAADLLRLGCRWILNNSDVLVAPPVLTTVRRELGSDNMEAV